MEQPTERDVEEISREIGKELYKSDFGARKPTSNEEIQRGRKWLETNRVFICGIIRKESVQRVMRGKDNNVEEQIRLLVDVVGSIVVGVPPNLVAKAIIVLGEAWFCK